MTAFATAARTVPDLLRDAAQAFPDRDAYVELGGRLDYAGLDRAADGLATLWSDQGVSRGDVVCLLLPSSIDYAICYQAALRLGAIVSGINPRLGEPERRSILARLTPAVTVTDGSAPPDGVPAGRVHDRAELAAAYTIDAAYPRPTLSEDDVVAVVWTSGTTDLPKGAVYDHRRLRAMADGARAMSRPGDRRLYPLPFSHTGYMTRAWDEFGNAMTCVITPERWTVADTLLLLERERVTVGQGVATQWELLLRSPELERHDLSALRMAMMGGSLIPSRLVRSVRERLGIPVVVRYTSTEACVTTGTDPGDPVEITAHTVGKPLPGVQVRLVDEHGSPVKDGTIGRVQSRSAAMMREYWHDPDRTGTAFTADGWLVTGDLGQFDAEGNLSITGRVTDMYIRGGYNVYPSQVEEVLRDHPGIDDVAVVGTADPVLGEIGCAYVVRAAGADIDLDGVRAWARGRISDYKLPDRVYPVDALPRTSMGKLDRRALSALTPTGAT